MPATHEGRVAGQELGRERATRAKVRWDEDLEGVPTETHHGRISKKTGKQKMEKEGMRGVEYAITGK